MTGYKAGDLAKKVGRECGDCDLCCTVAGVPGCTVAGERCQFLKSGTVTLIKPVIGEGGVDFKTTYHPKKGCSIYDKRPRMCRTWFCGWRLGIGDDDDRPDKTGIIPDLVGSGEKDQAGVGVRLVFSPEDIYLDREKLKRHAADLKARIEAGTAGDEWPAMKVVGPIGPVSHLTGGYDPRAREGKVEE